MAKRSLGDSAKDKLAKMANDTEEKKQSKNDLEHLNTRLPKTLIKDIKVYCVSNDISIQDFMTEAAELRLKK